MTDTVDLLELLLWSIDETVRANVLDLAPDDECTQLLAPDLAIESIRGFPDQEIGCDCRAPNGGNRQASMLVVPFAFHRRRQCALDELHEVGSH